MRHCEHCGGQLSGTDPFGVCPRCLFEEALKAGGLNLTEATPIAHATSVTSAAGSRRDFFDKYEILECIAEGGQGDLWKVWDYELRRFVAMKRLAERSLRSPPAVHRFLAEAQIAGQLEHPGILPIFDVGWDPDGRPFYTTQLLPGTTLADAWRRVREKDSEWTINRALESLLRVCEVMAHAHSRGVIHRDLKPSNILVGAFGDVRVIDWGSARVLERARKNFEEPFVPFNEPFIGTDRGEATWAQPASPHSTAATGMPITPVFMPPELLQGDGNPGPQTDIYSIGVMLYELLAGRWPYSDPDGSLPQGRELQRLITDGPPPSVRNLNRGVSRDLDAVAAKAMAHSTAERYATMEELADDIRAVLEVRPVKARRPGTWLKLRKWTQRNASYVLPGGAAILIICIILAASRSLKAERDVARQVSALRHAELATRNGDWRDDLRYLDEAQAAGYRDAIDLGLQRAEAWTVLNDSPRAGAILRQLVRRSDLGKRRGVVLLHLGEHELFNVKTYRGGVQHVREAQAAGLTGADLSVARGLLADSTPKALDYFKDALQLNPYDHGAHVQSLGLELLLGLHSELETHLRVFKILYPDDPTAAWAQAIELALRGKSTEALADLDSLRGSANPQLLHEMRQGLGNLAALAKRCDLDTYLQAGAKGKEAPSLFASDSIVAQLGNPFGGVAPTAIETHLAGLPCVRQGSLEASDAMRTLLIPYLGDPNSAVEQIKSSLIHDPEALVPALAGIVIEREYGRSASNSLPRLQMEADLFQLAADSPSVIPGLERLSRFLAAEAHLRLARNSHSAVEQRACLADIRRALDARDTSAAECAAYFKMAFELHDFELARALLDRRDALGPGGALGTRSRIRADIATGDIGGALDDLDQMLQAQPTNGWAQAQRNTVLEKLQRLLKREHSRNPHTQTHL